MFDGLFRKFAKPVPEEVVTEANAVLIEQQRAHADKRAAKEAENLNRIAEVKDDIQRRISFLKELLELSENVGSNAQEELKQSISEYRANFFKFLVRGRLSAQDTINYIQEALNIQSIVRFKTLPKGAFAFETQKEGWHLFASNGRELTKNAQGEVGSCNINYEGEYQYTDDQGTHTFDNQGKEMPIGNFSHYRERIPGEEGLV